MAVPVPSVHCDPSYLSKALRGLKPCGPKLARDIDDVLAAGGEIVFQPFRQLGPQRVGHGEGHGLGLAIVRAIADAHSAVLTVSPRAQGGLDIEVIFP